jgi:zinc finger SWIM domain-containing protein 3
MSKKFLSNTYRKDGQLMQKFFISRKILRHKKNPKTKLSQRRKEISRIFFKLAARAAESNETYFMAVSSARQLADDVEKSLGKRFDADLNSSTRTQGLYCATI